MDAPALFDLLADGPVIAAVKDGDGLSAALESGVPVIFLLCGDILTVGEAAARCHAAGKAVFVHLDLVEGLAQKEIAVDFIARNTQADGIISTRPALIRRGRELGLFTILRFFVFDSLSLENVRPAAAGAQPDMVEILPGIMPKIIARIAAAIRIPLICGGLIMDKSDVMEALSAGALAVSSTSEAVWDL